MVVGPVFSSSGATTGTLSINISRLMFDGPLALEQHTFGSIKALWNY